MYVLFKESMLSFFAEMKIKLLAMICCILFGKMRNQRFYSKKSYCVNITQYFVQRCGLVIYIKLLCLTLLINWDFRQLITGYTYADS